MTPENQPAGEREQLLNPVDRISEVLFGLIMAVTIIGSLSIASAGPLEASTLLAAALGCNVAWGMVDAVMYLLRTLIGRSHARTLARQVRAASPEAGRGVLAQALPEEVRPLLDTKQLEAMRQRLLALPPQHGMALGRTDFYAAIGIFWMVVLATFPVVLPFVWMDDAPMALHPSRGITLVMLFLCGTAFARYAGHPHPMRIGLVMAALGTLLILAVMALGG